MLLYDCGAVTVINALSAQIASAAEEQSSVAEEINRNIVTISQVSEQNSENAQQTSCASEDLAHLATELQNLVAQFKICPIPADTSLELASLRVEYSLQWSYDCQ